MKHSQAFSIQDLNGFGDGVGRLQEGKIVFVPKTLIGDEILLDSIKDQGRFFKARIGEILRPSPSRQASPCKHFDLCGGCQILPVIPSAYQEHKVAVLRSKFRRSLKDFAIQFDLEYALGRRNKALFDLKNGHLAYTGLDGETIPIEHCPILENSLQSVLPLLQDCLNRYRTLRLSKIYLKSLPDQLPVLGFFGSDPSLPPSFVQELTDSFSSIFTHPLSDPFQIENPIFLKKTPMYEEVGGQAFEFSPEIFFQTNRICMDQILFELEQGIASSRAVADLFCGFGAFLHLNRNRLDYGLGLEQSPKAIELAKKRGAEHLEFFAASLPQEIWPFKARLERCDTWLVNPPRAGMGQRFLPVFKKFKPRRVLYVSCNPVSLEADLDWLQGLGYRIGKVRGFDMFPFTMHFEMLVSLDFSL